jgi:hypothetical protein
MEYLLSNLGTNKVTLDIRTNKFEESYEYLNETYENFDKIENILNMYKDMVKAPPPAPPRSPPTPPIHDLVADEPEPPPTPSGARGQTISDRFIYCVLLSLDESISLIPDKNVFINKLKSELRSKMGDFDKKFKKYGLVKKDIIQGFESENSKDRGSLYHYVALVMNKSIVVEDADDMKLYEVVTTENSDSLIINVENLTCEEVNKVDCKAKLYAYKINYYKLNNTLDKLESFLVKDLKTIAEDIGLEIIKIENGKKKFFIKAELKDVIKSKLYT